MKRRIVKVLAAVTALVFVGGVFLGPVTGAGASDQFSDVTDTHPFHDEISWMATSGISTGFPDGTYRPSADVSRQAMAAFMFRLWVLVGGEAGTYPDPGFSDVDPSDQFYDEISWMAASGITTGFPDGTFRPTAGVSRQAMAAFMLRLWELVGGQAGVYPDPALSDVGPSNQFYDEIAWMVGLEIATGFSDGTFRPTVVVTRQAMAAFMARLHTNLTTDAVPVVNTATDGGDYIPGDTRCEMTAGAGDCSLRAAIDETNAHPTIASLAIDVGVNPTLTLAGDGEDANATGDLDVLGDLTIDGNGATISANELDRVIDHRDGELVIADATIADGVADTSGGGIRARAPLTVDRSTFLGNIAWTDGGAIAATAELAVSASAFTNNLSVEDGGAIRSAQAATVTAATMLRNTAFGDGGDIWSATSLDLVDSSLIEGSAARNGGSLRVAGTTQITRTAVTGPEADEAGAGIYNTGTLVIDRSLFDAGMAYRTPTLGGAVYTSGLTQIVNTTVTGFESSLGTALYTTASVSLDSTTVAGNLDTSLVTGPGGQITAVNSIIETSLQEMACGSPILSGGYNVVSDATCQLGAPTDLESTDPQLTAPADNGGPTLSFVPALGSPVFDRGAPGCPATDQRGAPRPAFGGTGSLCDAGAVEMVVETSLTLIVDDPGDTGDAIPGDGQCDDGGGRCTLRAAVDEANTRYSLDTIEIQPGVNPTLASSGSDDLNATGDIDVLQSVAIEGAGTTIDGAGMDRVFQAFDVGLYLSDLTLTGGTAAALRSDGYVEIVDSTIAANSGLTGGGLYLTGSALLDRVAVLSNQADWEGGGLWNSGRLTVRNTTFSRNQIVRTSSTDGGSAISSEGSAVVEFSTIYDNTGSSALMVSGPDTSLRGTVVSGDGGPMCSDPVVSLGYNAADDASCGLDDASDQQGVAVLLGPLADNGGPTLTLLPYANSPLVGQGGVGCAALDQRGQPRPVDSGGGSVCDIGAVEGAAAQSIAPLTLTVDTATDANDALPGDGLCDDGGGNCTLRAAIEESNAWLAADTITFAPGIDPTLSIAGANEDASATGDLDVRDFLMIQGAPSVIDGGGIDRVIQATRRTLTLTDLEIRGGWAGEGAGIRTDIGTDVTLDRVTVAANWASSGGGIWAGGRLDVTESTIRGNTARDGAALDDIGGLVSLDGVSIRNNVGTTLSAGSIVRVRSSTIENTTISSNRGARIALEVVPGTRATVRYTTIHANDTPYAVRQALGFNVNGSLEAEASIISSFPWATACETPIVSNGYNLASDGSCFDGSVPGDLPGTDPQLVPLGPQGGPTELHLPFAGSPVLDAIPNGAAGCGAPVATDQNGNPRPTDSGGGPACDMGAAEGSGPAVAPLTLVVDTDVDAGDADLSDGVCDTGSGACALRAAIDQANAWPTADRVEIAAGVDPTVSIPGADDELNLTGDFDILDSVTVVGLGSTPMISGGGLDRVFQVQRGTARFENVSITGGSAQGGGGIRSESGSTLELDGVDVNGNSGSGLFVGDMALIVSSTLADNVEAGLSMSAAAVSVEGTTIDGNGDGGVTGTGTLLLDSTTVSDNTVTIGTDAAAIRLTSGSVEMTNSTVSGNGDEDDLTAISAPLVDLSYVTIHDNRTVSAIDAPTSAEASIISNVWGIACTSPVTSSGYNIDTDASCLTGADPTDQPAGDASLLPLGAYGGPTNTHQPFDGADGVDAVPAGQAGCGVALTTDQRGVARPFDSGAGPRCDIGSVEGAGPVLSPLGLTVDTSVDGIDVDVTDGVCDAGGGLCTMRAAIDQTNAWPSADTITIGAGINPVLTLGGINEDANQTGDLDIWDGVQVLGGSNTVDGNALDRVVEVHRGPLTASDLTVTGGATSSSGGGILVEGLATLTLSDSVVEDNTSEGDGAGLLLQGDGQLTGTTIRGNTASQDLFDPGKGGAIWSSAPSLTITDSLIQANRAQTAAGIYIAGGTAEIVGSGMNAGFSSSPALYNLGDVSIIGSSIGNNLGYPTITNQGMLDITASTIRANATGFGGLIDNSGTMTVVSSTIADNDIGGNDVFAGAGTLQLGWTTIAGSGRGALFSDGQATVEASILSNPFGGICKSSVDVTSLGYNVASGSCGLTSPGDLQQSEALLLPIAQNGGSTQTVMPVSTSPAVDRVPVGAAGCGTVVVTDQRGVARPAGGACDSGAVEGSVPAPPPLALVVDTEAPVGDAAPGDGVCSDGSGQCSLEGAITEANAWLADTTITFAAGVDPLVEYGVTIAGSVDLIGNGDTIITATAAGSSRILRTLPASRVLFQDLSITGGLGGEGAGLFNQSSDAVLRRVAVYGNDAGSGYGGGIWNAGTLLLEDSEVRSNNARFGGGIRNSGTIAIDGSTISGNTAQTAGAVDALGQTTITRSTISGNGSRGAVLRGGANVTITASTFSGNIATVIPGSDIDGGAVVGASVFSSSPTSCAGPLVSVGYNVVTDSSCLDGSVPTDLIGVDPMLGPLADNGGPNRTHLPGLLSLVVDAVPFGTPNLCDGTTAIDQRGMPVPSPVAGSCDIGSVERQPTDP